MDTIPEIIATWRKQAEQAEPGAKRYAEMIDDELER